MSIDSTAGTPVRSLKRAQVRVITVFFMIYILVSGGSFGIEDMVSSSGPGLTLLLLVLLPVFWALPMALIASELGSAIPGEGGFYVWARRGLGDFWGFQTAWWWSLSIFVDSAVYVVLAIQYLQNWLHFSSLVGYIIAWAIIMVFTVMNVLGVRFVALSSTAFAVLILLPFFALIVVGLVKWQFDPFTPVTAPGVPFFGTGGVFALGLAIGVWMYSGYESMSTLSGEIRNPQRVIPRALMLVVPFIILMYVLPTLAGLVAYGHWDTWATTAGDGYLSFVEIGKKIGGSALGYALLGSALLGNLALYLDYLASGARPLFAIAQDGLFPKGISHVSRRWGTPVAAIVLMAVVNAVLVVGPFQKLVVIDVILFISAYVLIFVSAVRLRVKEPDLKRPFRVPLGTGGMVAMVIPPILIVIFTIYVNAIDRSTELFGVTGFKLLGQDVGWYGIAGFLALSRLGAVLPVPGHLWWAEHAIGRGRRRGDRPRRGRGSGGRGLMQTQIQVLSEDEKAQVHERTLNVLSSVGLRCDTAEGRRILAAAGADVDEATRRVRFPAELVESLLAQATRSFTVHGRRPDWSFAVGAGEFTLLADGGATSVVDAVTGDRRPTTPDDWRSATRLLDAIDDVGFYWCPTEYAADYEQPAGFVRYFTDVFATFGKHVQDSFGTPQLTPWLKEILLDIVFGGPDEVRERMPMSFLITPTSPLTIEHDFTQTWLGLRDYGLPVAVMPMPLQGATAPGSRLATLLTANCESDRHALPRPGGGAGYPGLLLAGGGEHGPARRPLCRRCHRARRALPGRYGDGPLLRPAGQVLGLCTQTYRPDSADRLGEGRRGAAVALADPDVLVGPGLLGGATVLCLEPDRPGRRGHPPRPPGAQRHPCARRPLARRGPRQGRPLRLVPRRALHAHRRARRGVGAERLRRAGQLGRVAHGRVADDRGRRAGARPAAPGRPGLAAVQRRPGGGPRGAPAPRADAAS